MIGLSRYKIVFKILVNGLLVPLVSVAITGIGADFTRLESFGKVDAFAESLVSYYLMLYVVINGIIIKDENKKKHQDFT